MGSKNWRKRWSNALALLLTTIVIMTALAMPAAAQTNDTGWRGEYFDNPDMFGSPTVVRTDPKIDFNWGEGVPVAGIGRDYFSVRWTRNVYFEAGRYRFNLETDDGMRIHIDGKLVFDQWKIQGPTPYSFEVDLSAGTHNVKVEYFEFNGRAVARVAWERIDQPAQPITEWRGEYFTNRWLSGSPSLVRNDSNINFDWGNGSPAWQIPADNFSVRWTRTLNFEAGRYTFTTETDDGVRLYVDGKLIIDRWYDMPPTRHSAVIDLSAGAHTIRMEYYEHSGGAVARLWWSKVVVPDVPTNYWRGEYYANHWLSGSPLFVRNDQNIDFNWGYGSPDSRLSGDYFSVRWTRNIYFQSGRYKFTTWSDDGVRLYVGDRLVIDQWRLMPRTKYEGWIYLTEGTYTVRLEYFEHTGEASVKLAWEGPIPFPSKGNLITHVPANSYAWIKVYRLEPNGTWLDVNPRGWRSIQPDGYLKIDGLYVDYLRYGGAGHPYRIELWVNNTLVRSVGNTAKGEPEFRIRADADNYTPW